MADSYEATLRYLWGLHRLGSRPGLGTIEALLEAMDHPERTFRSLHVTGSKGKGSTSAFCAAVFQKAGHRTGLYTSPHLLSYRERTVVDGKPIPKGAVASGIAEVRGTADRLLQVGKIDREPTYFELTTALAFHYFREAKVDTAVVEVGLGGRLDATNVIHAPVCAVTTLELEHTDILGPTLRDIATEKAGILHRGAWAVTGVESGEGLEVLRHEAYKAGVPLWKLGHEFTVARTSYDAVSQTFDVRTPRGTHPGLTIPLLGSFQVRNAGVAVAALDLWERATGEGLPEAALVEGLAATRWPGRLERLSSDPPFYVDAAHTPESVTEISTALWELEGGYSPEESAVLFSCLKDKQVGPMLDTLSTAAKTLVLVPLSSERAMPLKEMELAARARFPRVVVVPDVTEGVRMARAATDSDGLTLATGSIYLVAETLAHEQGIKVEEPRLGDPAVTVVRGGALASGTGRG